MLDKILPTATQPITALGTMLDNLFTSDEEKLDKKAILARISQQPQLIQTEINKIEAGHRSIWVAGWRPFIGWVCGLTLAYAYIIRDFAIWAFTITDLPALDYDSLMTLLYALLGLGGFRTFEKIKGRAK